MHVIWDNFQSLLNCPPAFKKEIADGLLKILSVILMRQPFRHPGTPKRLLSPSAQPAMASLAGPDAAPDVPFIVLGLRTLGTFDFEGNCFYRVTDQVGKMSG